MNTIVINYMFTSPILLNGGWAVEIILHFKPGAVEAYLVLGPYTNLSPK